MTVRSSLISARQNLKKLLKTFLYNISSLSFFASAKTCEHGKIYFFHTELTSIYFICFLFFFIQKVSINVIIGEVKTPSCCYAKASHHVLYKAGVRIKR